MNLLRALRSVPRRHLVVPVAVAAIVLTASMPAWAGDDWHDEGWVVTPPPLAPPAPAPPPRRESERQWYGWQPIVSDALSVVVLPVVALAANRDGGGGSVLGLAVASYLLAPPIIHLAHGRPGIAAASLGLRLGVPSGLFLLGAVAVGKCGGDGLCALAGGAVGALLGLVIASSIDAAALSWDNPVSDGDDSARKDAGARRAAPKTTTAVALTPLVGPRREGGFDVGVGTSF